MARRKFVIEFKRAPGDVLLLSGLVRDLKLTYGDRYLIDVRTQFPAIWRHNPHLTKLDMYAGDVWRINFGGRKDGVDINGMRMTQRGQKIHYLTAFHKEFERRTGIHVPVLYSGADLHLSKEEQQNPRIGGRYWIIVPGGKTDMTTKWWANTRYQEVVDKLRLWGLQFVQEGATKDLHVHPTLDGVLNVVGLTSIRDLIVNIYHAEGVICGCTFQMHICGALEKPCVVILGGREEPSYEAYADDFEAFGPRAAPVRVPHRVLHTLGLMPCCQKRGCWKRRVVPLRDGRREYDKSLCRAPQKVNGRPTVPKCMHMIESDHVAESVMSYYEDQTLEPVGKPTRKYSKPPERPAIAATQGAIERATVFAKPEPQLAPAPELIRETEQMRSKDKRPAAKAAAKLQPYKHPRAGSLDVFDHPLIGGKITVCVLLFGKEHKLHRRCLTSIATTAPPSRMDLRIACNQTPLATMNFIKTMPASKVYCDNKRRRKFQAMRQMFHDKDNPIETSWIVWFDDTAYVQDSCWLHSLAEVIVNQQPESRVALIGRKMQYTLIVRRKDPRKWFRNAPWFKKIGFCNRRGTASPNGDRIQFVASNFFAISHKAVLACDIPDTRITQSGGGIVIGAQISQGRFQIKQFNTDRRIIQETHQGQKRGYSEKYPWD